MDQNKRKIANSYKKLDVYKNAMDFAMQIFARSKFFPCDEKYSLTDQVRRSSRSVCSNIAEAWRKRRYKAAFISKLSDAETEAAETQVWIEIASRCGYITTEEARSLDEAYDHIMGQLILMINGAEKWIIRTE